jgi:hypothetical protein
MLALRCDAGASDGLVHLSAKEIHMRNLTLEEVSATAGGLVPVLLGILAFEWYQAENIQQGFVGFFDSMLEHQ